MYISVIIPVYNAAAYLERCLDSCCEAARNFLSSHPSAQRRLEIICVDDGSNDGSGDMLDRYANAMSGTDFSFVVIRQKNSGVVAARNAAIAKSQGDFCYFLDSDDWVATTAFADLAEVLDEATDIAFGNQCVVWSDKEECRVLLSGAEWTGVEYVNESLRQGNGCIGGKLFRRDICIRLSIDSTMRLNEDLLMNVEAGLMARKVRRIDRVNYYYNWTHENSLSKSKDVSAVASVLAVNGKVREMLLCEAELRCVYQDGYVDYVMRNALNAFRSERCLPAFSFYSKELRTVCLSSFRHFLKCLSKAKLFGSALAAGLVSIRLARFLCRLILLAYNVRKALAAH